MSDIPNAPCEYYSVLSLTPAVFTYALNFSSKMYIKNVQRY